MPDHFQEIYAHHAGQYDRLVSCEDHQGNILRALMAIGPLDGLEVIEMGAGIACLTRLLASLVRSIRAYDVSRHMLGTGHLVGWIPSHGGGRSVRLWRR
ncbi:MAG: hypothetical protein JXB30_06500 [Anaerolineae bacterium]|nr:hypothetical protein [Anaerolineae bacterium]